MSLHTVPKLPTSVLQKLHTVKEGILLKQQITFFRLLWKGKTIVLALPLALHASSYHAAAVTKFS